MVKVKALRAHDNPYGEKYRKTKGDEYEHPDPANDIFFGYVELAGDMADLKAEAEKKGVMPEKGSGKGGRIVKDDVKKALKAE